MEHAAEETRIVLVRVLYELPPGTSTARGGSRRAFCFSATFVTVLVAGHATIRYEYSYRTPDIARRRLLLRTVYSYSYELRLPKSPGATRRHPHFILMVPRLCLSSTLTDDARVSSAYLSAAACHQRIFISM